MENNWKDATEQERQVRQLVSHWAQAIRDRNLAAILAYHAEDMVLYDVLLPFQSIGIEAYHKDVGYWDTFFIHRKAGVFDFQDFHVVADKQVAFCPATMPSADKSNHSDYGDLAFQLTIGLKKINHE